MCQVSDKDDAMAEVVCAEPSAPYRVPHADFPAEACSSEHDAAKWLPPRQAQPPSDSYLRPMNPELKQGDPSKELEQVRDEGGNLHDSLLSNHDSDKSFSRTLQTKEVYIYICWPPPPQDLRLECFFRLSEENPSKNEKSRN